MLSLLYCLPIRRPDYYEMLNFTVCTLDTEDQCVASSGKQKSCQWPDQRERALHLVVVLLALKTL